MSRHVEYMNVVCDARQADIRLLEQELCLAGATLLDVQRSDGGALRACLVRYDFEFAAIFVLPDSQTGERTLHITHRRDSNSKIAPILVKAAVESGARVYHRFVDPKPRPWDQA